MPEQSRVDFYVLSAPDALAPAHFACRLAEKAYRLGHKVHLRTASAAVAADLDDLLWTFRQGSFVPHELAKTGQPPQSPVTIGHGGERPPDADLLINLADTVPDDLDAFGRIAEIIPASDESKALGRERFRRYLQFGLQPVTHRMEDAP